MAEIMQKVSRAEKSICGKCSHRFVCRALDNQPCFECNQFTEEVVRCKDCEYMEIATDSRLRWCNVWRGINGMGDEGFCNYGERKDNERKAD